MEIITIPHPGYTTLKISGELDAVSSVQADEAFARLMEQAQYNLHINFSGLDYISSAGIGVILSHQDEIYQNGGKILFSGLSPKVLNVFQLLGLNQLFQILDSEEQVAQHFENS